VEGIVHGLKEMNEQHDEVLVKCGLFVFQEGINHAENKALAICFQTTDES